MTSRQAGQGSSRDVDGSSPDLPVCNILQIYLSPVALTSLWSSLNQERGTLLQNGRILDLALRHDRA